MKNNNVENFIAIAVTTIYLILVLWGKADVAGFGMLAMYVIKKALDIREKDKGRE